MGRRFQSTKLFSKNLIGLLKISGSFIRNLGKNPLLILFRENHFHFLRVFISLSHKTCLSSSLFHRLSFRILHSFSPKSPSAFPQVPSPFQKARNLFQHTRRISARFIQEKSALSQAKSEKNALFLYKIQLFSTISTILQIIFHGILRVFPSQSLQHRFYAILGVRKSKNEGIKSSKKKGEFSRWRRF